MSVEKMEQYKEYKKHRKEILRKEKMKERLYAILGIVVCVVIIGGVGALIYNDIKPKKAAASTPDSLINWSKYVHLDNEDTEDESTDTDSTDKEDGTNADTENTENEANESTDGATTGDSEDNK